MSESLFQYRNHDWEEMKRFERQVVAAYRPFRGHIDPVLATLALVRVTRALLRNAPKKVQQELRPVLTAYLEGKTSEPGTPVLFDATGERL